MIDQVLEAARKRVPLIKSLAAEGTHCLRLVCDLEFPIGLDAYGLRSGGWVLFAQINEPSLVDDISWSALALQLSEVLNGPVYAIGGALKSSEGSKSLPLLFQKTSGQLPELVTTEAGRLYKLEIEGVLNPGLFMDQRLNRLRLKKLIGTTGAGPLMNLFSYTGAFSIEAAAHSCATLSVDTSKRYLAWELANHELNATAGQSRRIAEDAVVYLKRLEKRLDQDQITAATVRPRYVVIDPPTFSRNGKDVFRARDALPGLVATAAKCAAPVCAMLVSTNDSRWSSENFLADAHEWAQQHGFQVEEGKVPEDFQPTDAIGTYALKSVWLLRNL